MRTWLGSYWRILSTWLRDLGSAHVVDDGLGDRDEAGFRKTDKRRFVPRTGR
jgi:hypothetical protein